MARIAGIDLPKDKRIEIGLTYIYGIGRKSAQDILAQTGINPDTRVKDLTEDQESALREVMHTLCEMMGFTPTVVTKTSSCPASQSLIWSWLYVALA